jgi:RNA polymerase sigma-70 factor (ECF subfamily)
VRGGRGFRDEFSAFHASAYPRLAAQTLAITGDAATTRLATETTLQRVWRSWPSVRQGTDLLVRARWTAVLVAAERESTAPRPTAEAVRAAVDDLTGAVAGADSPDSADDTADTVVVAALQRLPRVQRRALVLHYMGGVSVRDLAALSGSSAEHIELLLDDGFTGLAASLDWSVPDEPRRGRRGPDLSFDWAAEVLVDTGVRLPERIAAPPPTVLLRHATVTHWSARVVPVAASAACAAVIAGVAQPIPPEVPLPAIYAEHVGSFGAVDATVGGDEVPVGMSGYAPPAGLASGSAGASVGQPGPTVPTRSVALTSLLDPTDRGNSSRDGGPGVGRADPRISAVQASADGPGGSRASADARADRVPPSDRSADAARARPSSAAAGTNAGPPTAAPGVRAAAPGRPAAAPAAPLAAQGASPDAVLPSASPAVGEARPSTLVGSIGQSPESAIAAAASPRVSLRAPVAPLPAVAAPVVGSPLAAGRQPADRAPVNPPAEDPLIGRGAADDPPAKTKSLITVNELATNERGGGAKAPVAKKQSAEQGAEQPARKKPAAKESRPSDTATADRKKQGSND